MLDDEGNPADEGSETADETENDSEDMSAESRRSSLPKVVKGCFEIAGRADTLDSFETLASHSRHIDCGEDESDDKDYDGNDEDGC